ncbi:MAG: hypothetical protein EXR67_07525 [Dehalococcoidia bacterium]|nr:hypothetical protein [Dehalococcoidia bacterium]
MKTKRSYVLAARPMGTPPEGVFISSADSFHSFRSQAFQDGHLFLLVARAVSQARTVIHLCITCALQSMHALGSIKPQPSDIDDVAPEEGKVLFHEQGKGGGL